jgi:glycine/D-amino acid oxidase-like deaminating enzyme
VNAYSTPVGRIVVIGGGIAGVSVAWALASRGRDVMLLEREPRLGQHSSGLNAGIFRLAVAEPVNVRLGLRSREIGEQLAPGGFVRTSGGIYPCADDRERSAILEASRHAGVCVASPAALPAWLAVRDRPALFSPSDGDIDIHGLLRALALAAQRCGAQLLCNAAVTSLDFSAGTVTGVLQGEQRVAAETVIDCTGAWSPTLTPSDGGAAIKPHRRHLFVIDKPAGFDSTDVVWDLTDGIYVKPVKDGLLVCPCDETPLAAGAEVPTDHAAQDLLREKLARWAPTLSTMPIRRWWAGLRPLTADHKFVVGPDPHLAGLFRVGGFGGHGMTGGPAAGEIAAALLSGEHPTFADELSPARLAR